MSREEKLEILEKLHTISMKCKFFTYNSTLDSSIEEIKYEYQVAIQTLNEETRVTNLMIYDNILMLMRTMNKAMNNNDN